VSYYTFLPLSAKLMPLSNTQYSKPKVFGPSSTLSYINIASNYKWKIGQIFVAFSEYLNFKKMVDASIYFSNFLDIIPFCIS
jgi:hypothetical protein